MTLQLTADNVNRKSSCFSVSVAYMTFGTKRLNIKKLV